MNNRRRQLNPEEIQSRPKRIFLHSLALTMTHPVILIYNRQFFGIGNNSRNSPFSIGRQIIREEGGLRLWNGCHVGIVEYLARCFIKTQPMNIVECQNFSFENQKLFVQRFLLQICYGFLSYGAIMLAVDKQNRFKNSFFSVAKQAFENPNRGLVIKGIILTAFCTLVKNDVLTCHGRMMARGYPNNYPVADIFRNCLLLMIAVPFLFYGLKMQVEECTLMEAIQKGNIFRGFLTNFLIEGVRNISNAILRFFFR